MTWSLLRVRLWFLIKKQNCCEDSWKIIRKLKHFSKWKFAKKIQMIIRPKGISCLTELLEKLADTEFVSPTLRSFTSHYSRSENETRKLKFWKNQNVLVNRVLFNQIFALLTFTMYSVTCILWSATIFTQSFISAIAI